HLSYSFLILLTTFFHNRHQRPFFHTVWPSVSSWSKHVMHLRVALTPVISFGSSSKLWWRWVGVEIVVEVEMVDEIEAEKGEGRRGGSGGRSGGSDGSRGW